VPGRAVARLERRELVLPDAGDRRLLLRVERRHGAVPGLVGGVALVVRRRMERRRRRERVLVLRKRVRGTVRGARREIEEEWPVGLLDERRGETGENRRLVVLRVGAVPGEVAVLAQRVAG